MFNAIKTYDHYRYALALPDAEQRQERLQRLDQAFLDYLAREEIFTTAPIVDVRFDESGASARPAPGMPGNGRVTMGGDGRGHVGGADHQILSNEAALDPIWHRWGVLLHGAAHITFNTLSQSFIPEAFPPAVSQVLNTHVFALFLDNPQRKVFEEAFADCASALILLSTQAPEARAEVEALCQARQRTRERYDALWASAPDQAETHVHLSDLALQRALMQPQPLAKGDLINLALRCASDGLVDHWRMNPAQSQEALERSWTSLNYMFTAGRVRRALEGNYDLAAAWSQTYPNHPLVKLWGPLTRQATGAQVDPHSYALHAQPDWEAAWGQLFGRAAPAISHALEGYRGALTRALSPPQLGLTQRRLPSLGRALRSHG